MESSRSSRASLKRGGQSHVRRRHIARRRPILRVLNSHRVDMCHDIQILFGFFDLFHLFSIISTFVVDFLADGLLHACYNFVLPIHIGRAVYISVPRANEKVPWLAGRDCKPIVNAKYTMIPDGNTPQYSISYF